MLGIVIERLIYSNHIILLIYHLIYKTRIIKNPGQNSPGFFVLIKCSHDKTVSPECQVDIINRVCNFGRNIYKLGIARRIFSILCINS